QGNDDEKEMGKLLLQRTLFLVGFVVFLWIIMVELGGELRKFLCERGSDRKGGEIGLVEVWYVFIQLTLEVGDC
uniref:hypothetical protein n=1 Tax=Siminovitchia fortis TaxID=254758 RepID=UPI001C9317CB